MNEANDHTLTITEAIAQAEAGIPSLMSRQIIDTDHADRGAVYAGDTGIPYLPTGLLTTAIALYATPASTYFLSNTLLDRIALASEALLRFQNKDGTVAMLDCNFHSPPDAAFVINALGPAWRVVQKFDNDDLKTAAEGVHTFLQRATPAVLTGGVHTPNHRWVMVSALAWLYDITNDTRLLSRIDAWLDEGFDLSPSGEWTERSNAIYNVVCANALIDASCLLHRPELRDPVARNLRLMTMMVHPNGDIVTDYSRRQDVHQKRSFAPYYRPYRMMARLHRNGLFAAMADVAYAVGGRFTLLEELAYPKFTIADIPREPVPTRYAVKVGEARADDTPPRIFHYDGRQHRPRHHPHVYRYRHDDTSMTVMAQSTGLAALRLGDIELSEVRIIPAYFGSGPVRFPSIEEDDDGLTLQARLTAWYNGPLPEETCREAAGNWFAMPHDKRPIDHEGALDVVCHIMPMPDGCTLKVSVAGQARCPVQIAWLFHPETDIVAANDHPLNREHPIFDGLMCPGKPGGPFTEDVAADGNNSTGQREAQAFLIDKPQITVGAGDDRAVLSGIAPAAHRLNHIRGDVPRGDTLALLVNEMAPFTRVFTLQRVQLED